MTNTINNNWAEEPWMSINNIDLAMERQQATEEGIDLSSLQDEFDTVIALDTTSEEYQRRAETLLDTIQTLPQQADYPYYEPSHLAGIQAARPAIPALPVCELSDEALFNKALGGWLGRCAGCMLGKPVEGKRSWQMKQYLKAQQRWPLSRYFTLHGATDTLVQEFGFGAGQMPMLEEGITKMVEDDDTNYTATGLAIIKQSGSSFSPRDVAKFWLCNIPIFHVCTAERVAYKNLVAGIAPPHSATYRNVYREWIGAQIRADFFGYVNPGNPERAADFAWRDAAVTHIKNGIYGEMWVAAMLAAAYVCADVETVIRAGLAQIPAHSRLNSAIQHTLDLWKSGADYAAACADLYTRWQEDNPHHWCHTISNAEVVAIALLWGEKDYTKTICRSVMPGFDTDCNGATAGSILGVILGAEQLPSQWIAPLNDTLETGVAGYYHVSISQMARETVELIKVVQGDQAVV